MFQFIFKKYLIIYFYSKRINIRNNKPIKKNYVSSISVESSSVSVESSSSSVLGSTVSNCCIISVASVLVESSSVSIEYSSVPVKYPSSSVLGSTVSNCCIT